MHVLMAIRQFSGFATSIEAHKWVPTGAPAVAQLIDGLCGSDEYLTMALVADRNEPARVPSHSIVLEELPCAVSIVGTQTPWLMPLKRIVPYGRMILQTIAVYRLARRTRADILYIDRANVVLGGLIARITRIPVVLRVMGVTQGMRQEFKGLAFTHRLVRWAYRSPFACVIASQDGSGSETWLPKVLRPGVPLHVVLNGSDPPQPVDLPPDLACLPPASLKVFYVGRIEDKNGWDTFVDAIGGAALSVPHLHAVVIGSGSLFDAMRKRAHQRGLSHQFTFAGAVALPQVQAALLKADLYVSVNRMGDLSNANMEAVRAGCACVFARPLVPEQTNFFDALFPPDSILRSGPADDSEALAASIAALAQDANERAQRATKTKEIGAANLPSWKARIDWEIGILNAAARRDVAALATPADQYPRAPIK
jgi:glycosyltransferase involved in cell wall biosynthesis